jgi:hypothetical protein
MQAAVGAEWQQPGITGRAVVGRLMAGRADVLEQAVMGGAGEDDRQSPEQFLRAVLRDAPIGTALSSRVRGHLLLDIHQEPGGMWTVA